MERKTFWFLISTGWFGETAHVNIWVRSEARKQNYNRPFSSGFTPQNWVVKRQILRKTHWGECIFVLLYFKMSLKYKMTCAVGEGCDRIKYFGEVYNLFYPPTHLPTYRKKTLHHKFFSITYNIFQHNFFLAKVTRSFQERRRRFVTNNLDQRWNIHFQSITLRDRDNQTNATTV